MLFTVLGELQGILRDEVLEADRESGNFRRGEQRVRVDAVHGDLERQIPVGVV